MTAIRENGATGGIGVLAAFAYDDLGRRTSLTRGNGAVTSYGYDAASRLTGLGQDFAGTAGDLSLAFGSYNPAGQIGTRAASNDGYAWTGAANLTRSYTPNALNQYAAIGGLSPAYNLRGNMTGLNGTSYTYSSENELMTAGTAKLYYDAMHRLIQTVGAATTRLEYDGRREVTEYSASGTVLRRYVHGPGEDEPLVWYEGSETGDRRWLHADERGSIVATSDGSGNVTAVNRYDEYGVPASGNAGRFQYTGQAWVPEAGLYYYKARMYQPIIGRFMQTDPVGYGAGPNIYGYVGGDPVNKTDPSGMLDIPPHYVPYDPNTADRYSNCRYLNAAGTAYGPPLPCPGQSNGREVAGPSGGGVGTSVGGGGAVGVGLPEDGQTPQRTQTPTPCQRAFLKSQLASRGLPTSQIDNLRFVSGLNGSANFFTRQAFNGGAIAVTQGTTVFVQPGSFNEVANFRSPIPFEEAYHTAQFASDGAFYSTYGILSVGGLLSMGDSYKGNAYEAFAQGASRQMFDASKAAMCPAGG